MLNVQDYYDRLSPFYHLIYGDWDETLERQDTQIQSLIQEYAGTGPKEVLDVACGIGTQSIALGMHGHHVTGSDISSGPLARAKAEADKRHLNLAFVQGDMRSVHERFALQFDIVMSMDNSTAHLLSDLDLLAAFKSFYMSLNDRGICIISGRDYDSEDKSGVKVKPYGLREDGSGRYLIFLVWDFAQSPLYDLSMYCVVDQGANEGIAHIMRSRLYAVGVGRLQELLGEAGFSEVHRHDDRFFQPVLVARK